MTSRGARSLTYLLRALLILGLSIATLLATSVPAAAYWSGKGSGSGSALTATLAAPTAVNAAVNGTDITVRWTASAGTPAPTGYYVTVTRNGEPAGPACATSPVKLITTTTCTDTQAAHGNYIYLVVAVRGSWTATSSPSNVVSVATQKKLAVVQSPSNSATSLAPIGNVIIQLQDANGNNQSGSGVSVTMALTTAGGATLSGGPTALTDASGRVTYTSLTIDKVGTYTVTASSDGYTSVVTTAVTITPGPPTRAVMTSGSPQSARITTTFAQPLVARATDAAGNSVAGANVQFKAPASGPAGTFTADNLNQLNVIAGTDGLASAQFKANATIGSYSVTATVGTISAIFSLTNTATAAAAPAPAATVNPTTGQTAGPVTTTAAPSAPLSTGTSAASAKTSTSQEKESFSTTATPSSAPDPDTTGANPTPPTADSAPDSLNPAPTTTPAASTSSSVVVLSAMP